MPVNRMLTDTATIRNYIGEVSERATYQDSVIATAKCEPVSKSSRSQTGNDPMDTLRLFIFDMFSSVASENGVSRAFVTPEVWNTLSALERESAWTIADGKDKIIHNGKEYLVTSCERYFAGSKRMWHWEVYAR